MREPSDHFIRTKIRTKIKYPFPNYVTNQDVYI